MNTDDSHDNVILFRAPATGCVRIAELLPWFLNGTLDESEAAEVREHLGACAECRAELAEAADIWRLLDQHPASTELAAYVEDPLSLSGPTRAELEQHLMRCSECRGLVDPASEASLPEAPARSRARSATAASKLPAQSRPVVQSWVSVAATLAAVTVLAILGWMAVTDGALESSSSSVAEATTRAASEQIATASPDQDGSRLSAFDWESGTLELMQGEESDRGLEVVGEPSSSARKVQPSTYQVAVLAPTESGSRGSLVSSLDFESGELPTDL